LVQPVHFLKTALPGGGYGYGYAERLRPLAEGFWAEAIAVPGVERTAQGWTIRPIRLADRVFTGLAYRLARPAWLRQADLSGPVPEEAEVIRRAARLLCTTAFGAFCSLPEVRLALAQDRLAAALAPVLAIPDLLVHEDVLAQDWLAARPEAAAAAQAEADATAAPLAAGGPALCRWRRRIRLAALRRLDAAAVGREIFAPGPALLGEAYAPASAAEGWTIRAGLVRSAQYWPAPETEARSRAARSNPALVRAVELGLFPWMPEPAETAPFAQAWEEWAAAASLREFEGQGPMPLFPNRLGRTESWPPAGFSVRIGPQTLAKMGASRHSLAAAGLCPLIADPFRRYCAAARDLLAEWSADVPALVAAKWGPFLARAA
jgi:hypothetical protein